MSIDAVSDSELDEAATPIAAQRLLRLGCVYQSSMQLSVCCGLAVLLTTLGTANALELGEVSVKSALGQPLQVEIPYRIAPNEQLVADCVSLARPLTGADGTPTYTLVNRIVVDATRIQVFGSALVREPLIGLNVRVQCAGVPHIVRSYMLFVDPPVRTSAAMLSSTSATATATATATNQQVQTAAAVAPRNSTSLRQVASPRARGQAGAQLTQGQTYRVVRGDTLSGIASRIAGRPGTIWQTANAVFAANPQAFINADPDLIEQGRSIEIPILSGSSSPTIPVVTVDSTTSMPAESQLASAGFTDAATEVADAPLVPSAERGARADIRDNVAPAREPAAPIAAPAAEAAAITATNPVDSALSRTTEETTRPLSTSIFSLLAFGAGVLLLIWSTLIVLRKRGVRADPNLDYIAAETASNTQPTPVVENGVAHRLAAETAINSSPQLLPEDSATVSMDPNIGMPLPNEVPADSVGTQRETDPVDASTIMMADVKAEFARNGESAATINEALPADRNTQTMTIVELELLQQDYEAELTLTQHNSPALREAIAELKATEAAYAAGGKRPTYEGGEGEPADASPSRDATESAETVAYRPRKRRSSAKG